MNNQFGADDWDEYLTRIEAAEPRISALGVTDYCSLDRYEEVLNHIAAGRLPNVPLVLPNVELRLPLMTAEKKPINIHLLISPEDSDHVERARAFLRGLKFEYQGEPYACERADLIRLGKKHKPSIVDDGAALEAGTNQFKVTPELLKLALKASVWAQENIIIAIAGGSNDGSSGLRDQDASLEATRVEIERMSHVIFSSQPAQRTFWLGEGAATIEVLETKWNGRKLCLHGSDAHELPTVGVPDDNRYTWIKGDPTFETLRQACIEPGERAFVGEAPPTGALAYRTIDSVKVSSANWLTTPDIPLNSGLVAIIGARGSGKTALADLIAAAANAATPDRASAQSFLKRAEAHLAGTTVSLDWADQSKSEIVLPQTLQGTPPKVQYLSQQFVDQLCSAEGMTDELLREIERVVFEAHPQEDRLGATSFDALLQIKAAPGRLRRERANDEIAQLAAQVEAEREAHDSLPALKIKKTNLEASIKTDKLARQGLIVSGGEERAKRLGAVNDALAEVQLKVDAMKLRERSLQALAETVQDLESRRLPAIRDELQADHVDAALTPEDWDTFAVAFKSDPKALIRRTLDAVRKGLEVLVGPQLTKPTGPVQEVAPFIPDDAILDAATLTSLKAESWRLGELIGLDASKTKQLTDLNRKIAQAEAGLEPLNRQIVAAEGAAARIVALAEKRRAAYAGLFDGFVEEQEQLAELYAALESVIGAGDDTLGKLSFTVRRVVDVEAWARQGEDLLDLRIAGAFRGRGELLKVARDELQEAWETGSSAEVAAAMSKFREAHDKHLVEHARVPRTNLVEYRRWAGSISSWLNSTDHISIQYGVQYDGVDIEQLSPGTRGIVLLLLYLSLDSSDDRPLIIDQPEENLDPKSIFDELVGRFRSTRSRRQIIIVTHNANLVVNTDADQVIIAGVGSHRPGQLPEITYTSGGLEDPAIRDQVCEILEGGKRAFEERARRLRFKLA